MLNETCYFEEPFDFMIIHYISLAISVIIYGIAFFVLLFRTPKHFSKYRNYLAAHIFSGFLLDFVMGVLWKVTVVLPVPIMCSNTFVSEFAPNVFQLLPACFAYTGASAISLFVYRMEAVIVHRSEQSMIRKIAKYVKYAFYVNIVFVILLTILIYPDLKNQKEYKMKMEVRFGTFKPYMWCDNCFFCNFDSNIFRVFFYVAGCAVVLGAATGGIAFHVTVKALSAVSSRLTAKTRATHRNYLLSLSLAAAVHVVCILVPLLGFLSAINVLISLSQFRYFPFILALVIQEHGALSTIIMFVTNNLLRKALKKMFFCDEVIPTVDNSTQNRGLLLEAHMGMIWKVTVVLPIPIMCSNSFLAEYAPIIFQFLPACLVYTGVSIVLLFIYRMEAIVIHKEEQFYYRRKVVHYSKYIFYISVTVLLLLSVLIYPDLKYQKDYKLKMEQRFGTFKNYMWCDNCFFFNFDSKLFKIFYVVGAATAALGSISAGLAFHVTVRVLKSVRSRLSPTTAAIQRNFMKSLVVMAAIHGVCIMLPLLGFLCAISIVVTLSQFPYFPYLLVLITQEHGALSTITMFLTNDLLRRTLFRMFSLRNRVSDSLNQSENNQSTLA